MEIFLPSVMILAVAGIVVFTILPRFGPMVLLVLSLALLMFGLYHHWSHFASEYRLSTWQDNFKTYGPGITIAIMIIFLMIFILSYFGKSGAVPAPNMPSAGEIMSNVNTAVNTALNNTANTINNAINNTIRNVNSAYDNLVNNVNTANVRNKNRSFFSEI
jgi:hypothetical protein